MNRPAHDSTQQLEQEIESAWARRAELAPEALSAMAGGAVQRALALLESGACRVAEPDGAGGWRVNAWLKQAVLLYFRISPNRLMPGSPAPYYDKVPLLAEGRDEATFRAYGARHVPGAIVRRGAHVARDVVLMPSFVNIGAYVGAGTMVDTWATVGSCAQIGKRCHLSGGVGIGGVLEPPGAQPVIVEDDCFIGSRAIIVEGVLVEREAVIGAAVTLTASTPIVDVSGSEPKEFRGRVPSRSVVIPGMRPKRFPAGEYMVPVALIIGQRKASTDQKTSLNEALRDFGVAV